MAGVKDYVLRLKYTMQEHHLKVSPIIQSAVVSRSTLNKSETSQTYKIKYTSLLFWVNNMKLKEVWLILTLLVSLKRKHSI